MLLSNMSQKAQETEYHIQNFQIGGVQLSLCNWKLQLTTESYISK